MTDLSNQPGSHEASLQDFGPATDSPAAVADVRFEQLFDMSLPVTIEFGRTAMTIEEVLGLGPGAIVQLDRMVGEPVEIFVSDRRFAEGEVVVVGEHFGVRITRVLPQPRDVARRER